MIFKVRSRFTIERQQCGGWVHSQREKQKEAACWGMGLSEGGGHTPEWRFTDADAQAEYYLEQNRSLRRHPP